jgi:DNA-binding MarR family transcriptional regulator
MAGFKQKPQNLTLGHLLANVSRLVGGRMRMRLEELGLPHAQGMVLYHLWRQDGIAQNILAQALHIKAPTASNTLQRMERSGWVRRRRDIADQRIVRIYLTEKARALRQEARNTFREMDRELTAVLGEKERELLIESLDKVRHYLLQATYKSSDDGQTYPGDEGKENQ